MPDYETSKSNVQRLLAQERDLIRAGDYATLTDLQKAKEEVCSSFMEIAKSSGRTTEALSSLQAQLSNNQALIKAAREGVAAAIDYVRKVTQTQTSLQTYDQNGLPVDVKIRMPGKVEQRT